MDSIDDALVESYFNTSANTPLKYRPNRIFEHKEEVIRADEGAKILNMLVDARLGDDVYLPKRLSDYLENGEKHNG